MLLACSAGGHLLQMLALRPAWEDLTRVWVTVDRIDARSLLADEPVEYCPGPPYRRPANVLRNLALAWRMVRRHRPEIVLTTGAGSTVPFAWIGRLHGARVIYVESVTRRTAPSLSCRLVAPFADRIYVQSETLAQSMRGARYEGTVL